MSTSWHLHCIDCKSTYTFDNTDRQEDLMHFLCKHAEAIANIPIELVTSRYHEVELTLGLYGNIQVSWFVEHRGHKIVPIDGYGRLSGQCQRWVECASCKTNQRCTKARDHEPPCAHEVT